MDRRSFLQGLMLAPVALPALVKTAKADVGSFHSGEVIARPISVQSLSAISANLGNVTTGILRSANGGMTIDFDKMVMVIEDGDEPAALPAMYLGAAAFDDEDEYCEEDCESEEAI